MTFDYRRLEPRRTGIHPALKVVVGIIGAICLFVSVMLLWVLASESGKRDYSMLFGVAFLGAFAWGCWLIASGRFDRDSLDTRPASRTSRVVWTVLFAANAALAVYELATGGLSIGSFLTTAVVLLFTADVIRRTWRDRPVIGR